MSKNCPDCKIEVIECPVCGQLTGEEDFDPKQMKCFRCLAKQLREDGNLEE